MTIGDLIDYLSQLDGETLVVLDQLQRGETTMPNANIIAEQLHDELADLKALFARPNSKRAKEDTLRNIRRIEAELDLPAAEQTPSYNGVIADPAARTYRVVLTGYERQLLVDTLRFSSPRGSNPAVVQRLIALLTAD